MLVGWNGWIQRKKKAEEEEFWRPAEQRRQHLLANKQTVGGWRISVYLITAMRSGLFRTLRHSGSPQFHR